jgi:Flp pilus assembly pilin Flp
MEKIAVNDTRGICGESVKMKKFLSDEKGATAVEYCLIGAAMAVCLVLSFPTVSNSLNTRLVSIGPMFTPPK